MAADPDGDRRFLNRFRQKNDVGEVTVFPIERRILLGPKFAESFDVLVGHAPAIFKPRSLKILKLLFHPADPESYDHPTVRKNVEAGEHFGRDNGITIGRNHHAGSKANALGSAGKK